jgi:hypothetical protein
VSPTPAPAPAPVPEGVDDPGQKCQKLLEKPESLFKYLGTRLVAPKDIGMLWGYNAGANALGVGVRGGSEYVFDLYTFSFGVVNYGSGEAAGTILDIGAEMYVGVVTGWRSFLYDDELGIDRYEGYFYYGGISSGKKGVAISVAGVRNEDGTMHGFVVGAGVGLDVGLDDLKSAPALLKKLFPAEIGSLGWGKATLQSWRLSYKGYKKEGNRLPTSEDADEFVRDIITRWAFKTANPSFQYQVIATAKTNGYLWDRYR